MRFVHSVLIAVITLLSAFTIFGQSREITEAELTRLRTEASDKQRGVQLRIKTSTTGYEPGVSSESITEYGPNHSYHFLTIKRENGVETKTEGIRIGAVRYTRLQDGNWTKETPQGTVGGGGVGSGSGSGGSQVSSIPPEVTIECLYIGSETIDGQATAHYRKTHTVKFTSRTPVVTRRSVDDYWFRTDGMLVKESREDGFSNSKQHYKSVTEYEYNKDIRITAPIPD